MENGKEILKSEKIVCGALKVPKVIKNKLQIGLNPPEGRNLFWTKNNYGKKKLNTGTSSRNVPLWPSVARCSCASSSRRLQFIASFSVVNFSLNPSSSSLPFTPACSDRSNFTVSSDITRRGVGGGKDQSEQSVLSNKYASHVL